MKNYIIFIINLIIWSYTAIICYNHINGGDGENLLFYSGISIGLLIAINLVYIAKKVSIKEIIFILINIILFILVTYLSLVFIQLDVR
ncbi:hypothetical protein QF023_000631 [Chryseobacterium sp. SLBN-27]|nr:hypothetical protein [Chryseobacterium sp. SLBN-27]